MYSFYKLGFTRSPSPQSFCPPGILGTDTVSNDTASNDTASNDDVLIDGYILDNCIATGSTTQIWEVIESGSRKSYAMKLMLPEAFKLPAEKKVFKMEANYYEKLVHPNLINFKELVVAKKRAYFIMEYFKAANLKNQITGNLIEAKARTAKILEALCQVMGYIHEEGLVHRDIKPDNILVSGSSEVKLIDFSLTTKYSKGVGKYLGGRMKMIQGTRTYIAPETILKKKPTPQTDMYSLGITLYELLTGTPPFKGVTPSELLKKHLVEKAPAPSETDPNITTEMDEIVLKLLEKKPADRPETMGEIASLVRNLEPFKEDPRELYKRDMEAAKAAQLNSLDGVSKLDSRADAMKSALGIKSDFDPSKARQPMPVIIKREDGEEKSSGSETEKETHPAPVEVPIASVPSQPAAPPPPQQMPVQPVTPYPPGQYPPTPQPGYPQQGYPPGQYPAPQPGYPQPGYPAQPYMPGQPQPGQPQPGYPQQGYPPGQYPQTPQPVNPQPGYPQQYPAQPVYPQQPYPQPGVPPAAQPGQQAPVQPPAVTPNPLTPPPVTPNPLIPPPNQPPNSGENLPDMDDLPEVL